MIEPPPAPATAGCVSSCEAAGHHGTAAVVLNYRTAHETVAAVRSLHAARSRAHPIVVVDNASGDASLDVFGDTLGAATVVAARVNGGFSAGCNLGIVEALRQRARNVLILNGDVVVTPDALSTMERALGQDGRLGIVGPAVVSRSDPGLVLSAGIRYDTRTGRMRHHHFGSSRTSLAGPRARVVDGVSGCAMLIRRDVFERIGLFAEEYFFGFEDLDFCLRARSAGFLTACAGGATVLHEGSLSIGRRSPRRVYFAARNHLLLAERCGAGSPRPVRWLRAGFVVALNLAHVLFTSDVPRWRGLGALVRGVRDYAAGRFGGHDVWSTPRR